MDANGLEVFLGSDLANNRHAVFVPSQGENRIRVAGPMGESFFDSVPAWLDNFEQVMTATLFSKCLLAMVFGSRYGLLEDPDAFREDYKKRTDLKMIYDVEGVQKSFLDGRSLVLFAGDGANNFYEITILLSMQLVRKLSILFDGNNDENITRLDSEIEEINDSEEEETQEKGYGAAWAELLPVKEFGR